MRFQEGTACAQVSSQKKTSNVKGFVASALGFNPKNMIWMLHTNEDINRIDFTKSWKDIIPEGYNQIEAYGLRSVVSKKWSFNMMIVKTQRERFLLRKQKHCEFPR